MKPWSFLPDFIHQKSKKTELLVLLRSCCSSTTAALSLLLLHVCVAQAQTNLVPAWSNSVAGGNVRHGAAASTNGTIYFTSDGVVDTGTGNFTTPALLHALTPGGSRAWSFSSTNGAASPATLGPDGTVYFSVRQVPDTLYTLFAVSPSGLLRWRRAWDEQIDANLAVRPDGRMLAASRTRHLLSFEFDGQSTLVGWLDPFPAGREGSAPVLAADGTMYYGVGTPVLYGQSYLGGLAQSYKPGTNITGLAIGPQGVLYLSCEGGRLWALNSDGTTQWQILYGSEIRNQVAVAPDGTILVPKTVVNGTVETGELIILDRNGLAIRTNYFTGAINATPALASDGTTWVADASGRLTMVSSGGEKFGEYVAAGLGSGPLVTFDGKVVVTTLNGSVIAFQSAPAPTVGWPMLGRTPERTHRDYTAILPPSPASVSASTNLADRVVVNWTTPLQTAATYDIWRGLTTNFSQAAQIAGYVDALSITDTNVMAGFIYYYWVRARNGFGATGFQGPAVGFMATDGRDTWHYRIPGFPVIGAAAGPDGSVYVLANNPSAAFPGTNNSRVVALGPTGEERWNVSLGLLLSAAPVVGAAGEVLVATLPVSVRPTGDVLALGSKGEVLWAISDSTAFQPPVVSDTGELLLVNGQNSYIIAPGGTTNWSALNALFGSPPGSSPPQIHGHDQLWLATSGGIGFGRVPGPIVWRNQALGGFALGMAPAPDGGMYVVNSTGVRALRPDGSERWNLPGTNFWSGPVLGLDGTLYVGTRTNLLMAINGSGRQVWETSTLGNVSSTPVIGQDGGVFFGTSLGVLQALNADGSPRWAFRAGSPIRTAPLITPSGNLVFGTDAGMVWALRADTQLAASLWPKYQRDPLNQGHLPDVATTVPGAVSNFAATVQSPGGTVIHLTWDSAPQAQCYEVWRAEGTDFSTAQLMASNVAVTLKFDDDLTRGGVSYSYWVRGVNLMGPGELSAAVSVSQTNQLWAIPFGCYAPVVSSNGTIFLTVPAGPWDWNGRIAAYDRQGSRFWEYLHDGSIVSAAVLGPNDQLMFCTTTQNGSVHAISTSGQVLWARAIGSYTYGDPVVDAYGTCYVLNTAASSGTYLRAFSTDGVPLWSKPCNGESRDHGVIGPDGTIYVAAVSSLMAATPYGELRWNVFANSRRWGTPAISSNGEAILAYQLPPTYMRFSPGGSILASNRLTGLVWAGGGSQREGVIGSAGEAYFVTENSLICVETNGAVRWTNNCQVTGSWYNYRAAVPALDAAGNIYVAGTNEVAIINRDGERVGRVELGTVPSAPPVLTEDGRLYIAANNRLYAHRALGGLDTAAPWPMYRHDPRGTGSSQILLAPATPTLLPAQPVANQVRIEWARPPGACVLELFRSPTPNLEQAVLVATSRAGELFATDTNAVPGVMYYYWGRFRSPAGLSSFSEPILASAVDVPVKWFAQLPDLPAAPPAIAPDGTLYTCGTNRLLALNPDTSIRWQIAGISGTPVVSADGSVVIRLSDRVLSVSAAGTTNWVMDSLTSAGTLVPAVGADGRVIVHRTADELIGVSSSNSLLWQTRQTNYTLGMPSIAADGSIVLPRGNTQVLRLNPDGADPVVINTPYLQSMTPPVLDAAGTMYLACGSPGSITAIRTDGTNLWRLASANTVQTAPVIAADGTVFAGSFVKLAPYVYSEKIVAVLPDGSSRWEFDTRQGAQASLALSADGILLIAADTNLWALAEQNGRVLWQMASPNGQPFGIPVLDYDGTLYSCAKGALLALQLKMGPAASAWPHYRQNPRQSACIQRFPAPEVSVSYSLLGHVKLHLFAPGGCVILKSSDLSTWRRFDFQAPSPDTVLREIEIGSESAAFFRLLSP